MQTTSHSPYPEGFYEGRPDEKGQNYNDRNSYSQTHKLVAKVIGHEDDGATILEIRNRLAITDEIELIKPIGPPKKINIEKFIVIKTGEELEVVNTNAIVKVYLEDKVEEMDMFRMKL